MGESVLLAITGELDVATTGRFRESVKGLDDIDSPSHVTVDLSRLDFIDAAGVAALVSLRNSIDDVGGSIRVRSLEAPRPPGAGAGRRHRHARRRQLVAVVARHRSPRTRG